MVNKVYAVVRDGLIENMIEWDGGDGWAAPEGATLAGDLPAGVGIGWTRNSTGWAPPPLPVPDPLARSLAVLQQLVDPKQADPSQADFSAAVADVLLSLAE